MLLGPNSSLDYTCNGSKKQSPMPLAILCSSRCPLCVMQQPQCLLVNDAAVSVSVAVMYSPRSLLVHRATVSQCLALLSVSVSSSVARTVSLAVLCNSQSVSSSVASVSV